MEEDPTASAIDEVVDSFLDDLMDLLIAFVQELFAVLIGMFSF